MKRGLILNLVLVLAVLGFGGVAYAGNSYLNVTVSNVTGMTSTDPYSMKEGKDDGERRFYISLTRLTNSDTIYFTSYRSTGSGYNILRDIKISDQMTYTSSNLYSTITKDYYPDSEMVKVIVAGEKYYVRATVPAYKVNVNAVGTYCP